jgi:hypothetical protein
MGTEAEEPVRDASKSLARLTEWILLDGDRFHVMAIVVAGIFSVFLILDLSGYVPLRNVQPLYYVYSGLISGNLTLITVVVAINQLLLSREFHSPGELESQIEGVVEYRDDLEEMTGEVAPITPPEFLRVLVESTRRQAQELDDMAVNETTEEVRDDVAPIVSELTAQADHVVDLVRESETSTFEALAATLSTDYAPQINRLRQIQYRYADELPADLDDSIDELVHRLKDVDIARQYFKTLYLQEELATLSRHLFYVGLASLVVIVSGLLILTAPTRGSVSQPSLRILVPVTVTVGFAPISLLFAFIVRVATVTQRTVSTIPFTTSIE